MTYATRLRAGSDKTAQDLQHCRKGRVRSADDEHAVDTSRAEGLQDVVALSGQEPAGLTTGPEPVSWGAAVGQMCVQ